MTAEAAIALSLLLGILLGVVLDRTVLAWLAHAVYMAQLSRRRSTRHRG